MDKIKVFKPKIGDRFFYVSVNYCCHCNEDDIKVIESRCKNEKQIKVMGNNCFQTRKQAAIICDRVRRAFNLSPLTNNNPVEMF